jgi:methanogenic corrinoid protein MtbC1
VTAATPTPSPALLELARAGRPRPAISLALNLLREGLSFRDLVAHHLVPVQREVGRLWQEHLWSVADEHAATAVIDGVLGAAALDIEAPAVPRGEVLVACVEQEYHSLPARLGAELLRDAGWSVTFLGGSVPAQDLQLYAVTAATDLVVLSCTVAENLPGARRGVAAISDLGLPAVVAGGAVGTDLRARWLGASAWIGPTDDPTDVLSRPLPPARRRDDRVAAAVQLDLASGDIAAACMERLFPAIEQMSRYTPAQLSATRSDVDHLLRHLVLALDVGEPAIFHDLVRWLAVVLQARNVPASVLPTSLDVLAEVLRTTRHADAGDLCADGRI